MHPNNDRPSGSAVDDLGESALLRPSDPGSDCFDPLNLRHVGPHVTFDALGERDAAGGAPDAGAEETDPGDALGGDVDELDVPAVGLDRWPDEAEDALDAFTDVGWLLRPGGGRGRGHDAG